MAYIHILVYQSEMKSQKYNFATSDYFIKLSIIVLAEQLKHYFNQSCWPMK